MNLTKREVTEFLRDFSDHSPHNRVPGEIALSPGCARIRIFERLLVGISSAQDDIYSGYGNPEIVGANYLPPLEWMDNAQSVTSFFNPFTEEIKKATGAVIIPAATGCTAGLRARLTLWRRRGRWPMKYKSGGGKALVPVADERFKVYRRLKIYSN